MEIPGIGIAFMSAGHNFEEGETGRLPHNRIDFSKYTLNFGFTSGEPGKEGTIKQCKLSDFGEFTGSIGYGGKRRFFPDYNEEK